MTFSKQKGLSRRDLFWVEIELKLGCKKKKKRKKKMKPKLKIKQLGKAIERYCISFPKVSLD